MLVLCLKIARHYTTHKNFKYKEKDNNKKKETQLIIFSIISVNKHEEEKSFCEILYNYVTNVLKLSMYLRAL